MKKITLQWRITLLTALVLAACTGTQTVYSIMNAQSTFLPMMLISVPAETLNGQQALDSPEAEVQWGNDGENSGAAGAGYTGDWSGEQTYPGETEPSASASVTEGTIDTEGMAAVEGESDLADTPQDLTEAVRTTEAIAAKRSYDSRNILFCVIIVMIGTAAVYVVTGRALRPVRVLSKKVSSIDEHNLSAKLPEAASQDEVGELTRGCNRMLRRLEEAFQRQKRFTASAAHELKTPLAIMKAGIQVLSIDENTTAKEYRENAQVMEKSIDRLSQVVEDLLLLASAGERAENQPEPVEAAILCEAICSELEPLYEERNIKCTVSVNDICINGNAGLLYRAFFNLIENAFKYNRMNGSITITGHKENNRDIIIIEDTGHGIDPEHLPMIFEAFYRVDNSRSRRVAGAGLGLSIVKAVLEQYGGEITAESKKGEGTKFMITFLRDGFEGRISL